MAMSKDNEEGAIKYGNMFAVHPKNDCPHVQGNFQNPKDASKPESAADSGSQASANPSVFHLESSLPKEILLSHMRAVIYGNCIGDAIGLLTEFMTKEEAREIYGTVEEKQYFGLKTSRKAIECLMLEYENKIDDFHRSRWKTGDWTDDSDQMILILRTLLDNNGKANYLDFAKKFKVWTQTGYKELGDFGGMGIGQTTFNVILQRDFLENPHKCAYEVWDDSGRWVAPNGGVMRTSILGIQDFSAIPTVIENTRQICKVTHADPRCIASCVAVTTAIALMLQGKHCKGKKSDYQYDVKKICDEAYEYACGELETPEQKEELRRHMFAENLLQLELSGDNKIGYTYKCLGAGFWAFRQEDFRKALTELVMEAGDADTNGAVAGALLGCKLGVEKLPGSWLSGLCYKDWLDDHIDRYFSMLFYVQINRQELELERQAAKNMEERSRALEKSFTAERQAKEETEGRLRCMEQKFKQLEETLSEEKEKRKDVEKQLQRSEQRSLLAERQAKEEKERQLESKEQGSSKLDTSSGEVRRGDFKAARRDQNIQLSVNLFGNEGNHLSP